jgi:ferritin
MVKGEHKTMNKTMQDAMNKQIQAELYASYIYLSMGAYCEANNLPGAANWMRLQSQEELEHAMKFFDHINERGGRVTLLAIEAPPVEFESPLAVFKMAYAHEQKVTGMIHDLYKLAIEQNDYAALSMLQWFVDEQVEEEQSTLAVVERLEMIGDSKMGLFMVDRELGQRQAEEDEED